MRQKSTKENLKKHKELFASQLYLTEYAIFVCESICYLSFLLNVTLVVTLARLKSSRCVFFILIIDSWYKGPRIFLQTGKGQDTV